MQERTQCVELIHNDAGNVVEMKVGDIRFQKMEWD